MLVMLHTNTLFVCRRHCAFNLRKCPLSVVIFFLCSLSS